MTAAMYQMRRFSDCEPRITQYSVSRKKQSHQRFGALDNIGHALGLQRVQQPKQGYPQRQPGSGLAVTPAQLFAFEHSSHDTEETKDPQADERRG
jgi:hypothetical protein